MIRKKVKAAAKYVEVSRSILANSPFLSFAKGFAEGYGSFGYMFKPTDQAPQNKSLAYQLAQSPENEKRAVAAIAKRIMVNKYVGKARASKLCSAMTKTGEGRFRRIDGLMIRQDFATAFSKIHG
jgi:hypothetical protein